MTPDVALGLTAELLKQALLLCLPLLVAILLVSVIVSILQVVTQMQDPSIAFVPKFVAFLLLLGLLAPWMLSRLTAFGISMLAHLDQ